LVWKYAIWQPCFGRKIWRLWLRPISSCFAIQARVGQGCQISLGTIYQYGKNVPNYQKISKWP
jgi:hypothetical protein